MKNIVSIVCFATLTLAACKTALPKTSGDPLNAVAYGYQPLDPLPVDVTLNGEKIDPLTKPKEVLDALSDETIRLVMGEVTGGGHVTYGTAKMGYKGRSYEVIIDYMKFQTYGRPFKYAVKGEKTDVLAITDTKEANARQSVLPLYVGVGLRLKASITVNEGNVDLGNLFSIGAAAQAKKVTGTLIVQTLGITGNEVTGLIPMPTDISPASIQTAIGAVAAIKSKIYDPGTKITPRTIGFYNVLGGGQDVINELISDCLQGNATVQLPSQSKLGNN